MSKRVLIIGAGAVGRVVAAKCLQAGDVFGRVCLASRRRESCEAIARDLPRPVETAQVDAGEAPGVARLIREFGPDLVIHVALPYQDLSIMDACLETGVHYLDTANYEPRETARFEYRWQWDYHERFRDRGITALLGCGFDPGATNAYCAHARKHLFDRIDTIDILDCNAGENGLPFATNFNPEINIREVTAPGRYWEEGKWIATGVLDRWIEFDFPGIGPRKAYLMHHEEIESLCRNIPGVRRIRFWMAFGDSYLERLEALRNVGLTRIDPVDHQGHPVVPLEFLKTLLPAPATLGARTKGRTCIGCLIEGEREGKRRRVLIHNICDHQECYREVGSQAVAYTTGVPAMAGARMILQGLWKGPGVFNVEQFDPDPFMEDMARFGLPWQVKESGLGPLEA